MRVSIAQVCNERPPSNHEKHAKAGREVANSRSAGFLIKKTGHFALLPAIACD